MQLKGRQMIFKDVSQIGLFLINNFVLHIFFLGAESCLWCVGPLHLLTEGGPHGRVCLCVNSKEFRKSKSMRSCEGLFISTHEFLLSTYYVTIIRQAFFRERDTWKNQAGFKKYQKMTHHCIAVVLIWGDFAPSRQLAMCSWFGLCQIVGIQQGSFVGC